MMLFKVYSNIIKVNAEIIVESINSVDLDEAAHNEPPHLHLPSLPLVFEFPV